MNMFNITSGSKEGAISIGLITNMFLALSHFILFSVFRLSPAHCMGLVAFGKAPIGTPRSIPPGAIHPCKVVGQPLKEHTCLPRKVEVGYTLYISTI